ncbi:P-II family nitrogen regulator [Faecalicatena contorta]|uniref:Nitrogen regulatory protein P-II family n=1 Tax=Faecalicatena contorta TaxID=39482 RepID=A0A316A0L0_9FIRM|nr:P-II family nitrogen regulator [Faecalicatena contorta]PWJ51072.1 nitrogen regulatory protein P-II family [Faecalicatena contorta]SUQ13640.1 nitrogen regulatory protein P-II family [Faecalicatena contorta]
MVKIDAIVNEEVYEDLKDALNRINVHGITVSQVMGCGIQKGYSSIVRGTKVDINMLPKIKFEIVVSTEQWVDKVVDVICEIAYTGNPGDGKIFVCDLKDAVRIRTGQRGNEAIY